MPNHISWRNIRITLENIQRKRFDSFNLRLMIGKEYDSITMIGCEIYIFDPD